MADTIGSGPERPVAARPRWLRLVAGVAVAVLLGWLGVRAGGDGPAPPVAVPTTTPAPPPASPTPPPPEPAFRLDGEPGAGPDVRLLVGRVPPGRLDARTGRLTPLPGLRVPPDAQVQLSRGPGLTAALVFDGTERTARGVLLPDGGGPVELGRLVDLLPRRDGTVLTVTCLPGGAGGCVLANRTGTGAVRWQRRVAGALSLVRDTPYGLLVTGHADDRGAGLRLEDARTGRVGRTIAASTHVLTADDRRVVYERGGCDYGCPLVVAELAGDGRTRLPVRPGRPVTAALSPDGSRLAVGYQGLHPQDPAPTRDRDGRVVLVELATGRERPVAGLSTGAKAAPVPVWTPDGGLLLAVADPAATTRLAVWRAGRLTVLPVRLPRFPVGPGQLVLAT